MDGKNVHSVRAEALKIKKENTQKRLTSASSKEKQRLKEEVKMLDEYINVEEKSLKFYPKMVYYLSPHGWVFEFDLEYLKKLDKGEKNYEIREFDDKMIDYSMNLHTCMLQEGKGMRKFEILEHLGSTPTALLNIGLSYIANQDNKKALKRLSRISGWGKEEPLILRSNLEKLEYPSLSNTNKDAANVLVTALKNYGSGKVTDFVTEDQPGKIKRAVYEIELPGPLYQKIKILLEGSSAAYRYTDKEIEGIYQSLKGAHHSEVKDYDEISASNILAVINTYGNSKVKEMREKRENYLSNWRSTRA